MKGIIHAVVNRADGSREVHTSNNRIHLEGDRYYSRRISLATPAHFVDTGGDFNGRFYMYQFAFFNPNDASFKTATLAATASATFAGPTAGKDPDSGYPRTADPDTSNPSAGVLDLTRTISYRFTYATGAVVASIIRIGIMAKPSYALPGDNGQPFMCAGFFSGGNFSIGSDDSLVVYWNHQLSGPDGPLDVAP